MKDEAAARKLRVEVVYALRGEQALIALEVGEGTPVRELIERSGILGRIPLRSVVEGDVGIFGKVVGLDTVLRDGDRVEIYRPLVADPQEMRRQRARRSLRR